MNTLDQFRRKRSQEIYSSDYQDDRGLYLSRTNDDEGGGHPSHGGDTESSDEGDDGGDSGCEHIHGEGDDDDGGCY